MAIYKLALGRESSLLCKIRNAILIGDAQDVQDDYVGFGCDGQQFATVQPLERAVVEHDDVVVVVDAGMYAAMGIHLDDDGIAEVVVVDADVEFVAAGVDVVVVVVAAAAVGVAEEEVIPAAVVEVVTDVAVVVVAVGVSDQIAVDVDYNQKSAKHLLQKCP